MQALPYIVLIVLILTAVIVVRSRRASGASGTIAFSSTLSSNRSVAESRAWAITSFASALREARYNIESQSETQLTFTRTYRTGGTWALTILLFPIGLLFFVANRRIANITMLLSETSSGSEALISGEAPARLVAQIEAAST